MLWRIRVEEFGMGVLFGGGDVLMVVLGRCRWLEGVVYEDE